MFELLISVSGVGAKSANTILANITPSNFALAVITNNVKELTKLPGIGAKSAQRIILELKDKFRHFLEFFQKSLYKIKKICYNPNTLFNRVNNKGGRENV